MWKEFKKFAIKGNAIDLAVGIIVGGAFGKIVSSLVNDIIMPPIGLILGKVNFSDLFISLDGTHYKSLAEAKAAGAATLNYGMFINNSLDFIIVAFSVYIMVKQIEKLKKEEAPAPLTTKQCPFCLSEIPLEASRCSHCTSHIE